MQGKNRNYLSLIFLRIIPLLMIAYLIVFTGMYIHAMRSTVADWNTADSDNTDTTRYTDEEWALFHYKAFLKARLNMSESDSIGLTLNLKDSLVQLEMKGVVLRQVKMEKMKVSRFFKGINPAAYAHHFSLPFAVNEISGTIEKNPVTVRKVPKDSIEAAQTQASVDTTEIGFVEWHMSMDNSIVINVVQTDQDSGKVGLSTLNYRLKRSVKSLISKNIDFISGRKIQVPLNITVYIPANEAMSFYRALPYKGRVVVRL